MLGLLCITLKYTLKRSCSGKAVLFNVIELLYCLLKLLSAVSRLFSVRFLLFTGIDVFFFIVLAKSVSFKFNKSS